MARRGQDGYWPYLDEALRYATGLEEPMWLLFVHLARIEAYWLEGRTDAAVEELDRIRYAFEASPQLSAVGSHCGNDDSPGSLIQLI